ncbi:unnamed protein product [Oppiella nova]|uniref:GH18 domain-containing protein n=1 Tax=Oppiella nova TaxID=334625 RepID=A0A7R9LHL2_9ACAR|nr:unnamed protein product [Oppiella nova]CAG2163026.1 unnamed protein product [Oppiella nova]
MIKLQILSDASHGNGTMMVKDIVCTHRVYGYVSVTPKADLMAMEEPLIKYYGQSKGKALSLIAIGGNHSMSESMKYAVEQPQLFTINVISYLNQNNLDGLVVDTSMWFPRDNVPGYVNLMATLRKHFGTDNPIITAQCTVGLLPMADVTQMVKQLAILTLYQCELHINDRDAISDLESSDSIAVPADPLLTAVSNGCLIGDANALKSSLLMAIAATPANQVDTHLAFASHDAGVSKDTHWSPFVAIYKICLNTSLYPSLPAFAEYGPARPGPLAGAPSPFSFLFTNVHERPKNGKNDDACPFITSANNNCQYIFSTENLSKCSHQVNVPRNIIPGKPHTRVDNQAIEVILVQI